MNPSQAKATETLEICLQRPEGDKLKMKAMFLISQLAPRAYETIGPIMEKGVQKSAEISEGRGSRVRIALHGVRAVFHRPHPRKETDRGAVASMRRFLIEAGIHPSEEDL
jgi:hypothetical protein